jgi:hypothetical protein
VGATRVLLSALLCLTAVAFGCGGSENERPVERESAAGFTTYDVPSAGISLAVPNAWKTATADEVFDENAIDSVGSDNPEIASIMRAMGKPDSPMKFFAFDPDVSEGFATNANVVVEDVPGGFTLDEYFEAGIEQLKRIARPEDLKQERVELPAGPAMHLTYEQSAFDTTTGPGSNLTVQYVFFADDTAYILSFAVLPERLDEYEETFLRSAKSFRIG